MTSRGTLIDILRILWNSAWVDCSTTTERRRDLKKSAYTSSGNRIEEPRDQDLNFDSLRKRGSGGLEGDPGNVSLSSSARFGRRPGRSRPHGAEARAWPRPLPDRAAGGMNAGVSAMSVFGSAPVTPPGSVGPIEILALVVGVILGLVGGYFYNSVVDGITPLLPPNRRNNLYTGWAINSYIWHENIPQPLRRHYINSRVAGVGVLLCMSVILLSTGKQLPGLLCAAAAVGSALQTAVLVIKHRDVL